jgi:WD40 repeat protein
MQTSPSSAQFDTRQKRKRFPWMIGILLSVVLIAILVFIVVTLLILRSQGMTQAITTLTIISIIAGFAVSLLSLLVSFLQWHHPKAPPASEDPISASSLQTPPSGIIEQPQSQILLNDPQREYTEKNKTAFPSAKLSRHFDWEEVSQIDQLYGRDKELTKLKQWMVDDSCRIVAILGMGGIGKTSLAATLVDQVQEHYDYVFGRSLHNAPPLKHILQKCIQFVSDQQQTVLPEEEDSQISLLIEYLRTRRCLLVLDNVESILQGESQAGCYREEYQGYGKLLQRIGESRHQSCLLITSREKPKEVALLEGEATAVRSYRLAGLSLEAGRDILKGKGLQGTEQDWEVLITHYGGNPLVLRLVAQEICEVFGRSITAFLKDGELFFRDVSDVLKQQVNRLSAIEEEIIHELAIEREVITIPGLQENIIHSVSKGELQEALRSLQRRQMIETSAKGFTLHHVIMEYLTDCLVDRVCEEIKTEALVLFEKHALLKAQAKEYIRESQRRLIVLPLLQRLLTIFGKEALEQRLQSLLATLRTKHDHHPSYAAGNVLNLLIQGGYALRGYDFSRLAVRQAYLQEVDLPEVNFAHADLATSVFTDTFGIILSVALSSHGDLLAAGTTTGEIRFWHAANGLPLQTIRGHNDWVRSVTFSPDGKILASGSDDQTIHLWEVSSGQCLNTLQGHSHWVSSVAFSPDGKILASGGDDQAVRLWEVSSGQCLNTLQGHSHWVSSVAFSPDGKILVSGSEDQTIRLWEVSSGQCFNILQGHTHSVLSVAFSPDGKILASGSEDQTIRLWKVSGDQCLNILQSHTNAIRSVAFSPDGKILASGSEDQTIRLWEVSSGQCLNTLQGHSHWVSSVAFSPDGKILVSGSEDRVVRLWEVSSGQCLNTLQGHTNAVLSVAFSPDGKILASGSYEQTVRLWEVSSGQCLNTLHGHSHWVRSVAFSPDGKILASGSEDRAVRLWEVSSGQCLNTLQGHSHWVSSVAFSPDGKILASGGDDQTVCLWEVSSGQCLNTLHGHTNAVRSVAFSPDGKILAIGSEDQTIRLWEVSSGQCFSTLQGHTHSVLSVAFSPDGKILASGSHDQTICLWKVSSGQCLNTLHGHAHVVRSVAFSPDGKTLASGSYDQTIRLWEVSSGQCLNTLQGHSHWVRSVAFSPDGKTLASGSYDGAIKLWDRQTGACLRTLRSDRPYERMNITQVKGLTEAQKATLRSLGAIEDEKQELV